MSTTVTIKSDNGKEKTLEINNEEKAKDFIDNFDKRINGTFSSKELFEQLGYKNPRVD